MLNRNLSKSTRIAPVVVLVLSTLLWGSTFVPIKALVRTFSIYSFLGFRFSIGAVALLALKKRLPEKSNMIPGFIIGFVLGIGYIFQTYGIKYSAPGIAGVITGLFVVFTPFFEWMLGGQIAKKSIVAVIIALFGTALLVYTPGQSQGISIGDILVFLAAVTFAAQILFLSRWTNSENLWDLVIVELATVGVMGFAVAGATHSFELPSGYALWTILGISIAATSVPYILQAWSQSMLNATESAVILATEPVWALLTSILFAHETFSALQIAGILIVLLTVTLHEAIT
jgi:drug/metabolite transporter (DMT)-like permease